jgi:DNA-binding NtrC family response regulator
MTRPASSPTPAPKVEREPRRVLIVEDETLFAAAVRRRLEKAGLQCAVATTLAQARAQLQTLFPDIVLLDLRLPDGSGMQFLESLATDSATAPAVIVLTAFAEVDDAVQAMKRGAADYLKKPIDLDELLIAVEKVLEASALRHQLDYSRQRDSHAVEDGALLLGDSPALVAARDQLLRMAQLKPVAGEPPPNVLILGETGSGKDVAARLLHVAGARRERPFVHVDCAALPRELMEAELFGHEKGAFTSAAGARAGLIEAAEDGSVFLDEIGELPLELQAKLLTVIERRRTRRIGAVREHSVQAQFIAATNRDLARLVAQGGFRADLFYRLNVLTVRLPPLRERGADILRLARAFLAQTARRYGVSVPAFGPDAERAMRAYGWPGNVRELRHLVERAALLTGGREISAADLGIVPVGPKAEAGPTEAGLDALTLEEAERLLIQRALQASGGNVSEAARRLGVSRMTMRYRMEKYSLKGE